MYYVQIFEQIMMDGWMDDRWYVCNSVQLPQTMTRIFSINKQTTANFILQCTQCTDHN